MSRPTHTAYALCCLGILAVLLCREAQTGRTESFGREPTQSQKPFWLLPWCVEGEGYTGASPFWPPYRQRPGRRSASPLYESNAFPGLFEGKPNGPVVGYLCNTILECQPRERWSLWVCIFAAQTEEVAIRAQHANETATSISIPWEHESLTGEQIGDRCVSFIHLAPHGGESMATLHFRRGRVCVSMQIMGLTVGTVDALDRQAGGHSKSPRFGTSTAECKAEADRIARLVETKIVYGGYAEPVATGKTEIASGKIATKRFMLDQEWVTVCFLEDMCSETGMTADWDREWRRVTLRRDQASCELELGRASLRADGKVVPLPIMPFLWGAERARTVIPMKHVAAALGLEVR